MSIIEEPPLAATIGKVDAEYVSDDFFYLFAFVSEEKGFKYKYHVSHLPEIGLILIDMQLKHTGAAIFFDDVVLDRGLVNESTFQRLHKFLIEKFNKPSKIHNHNRLMESFDSLRI